MPLYGREATISLEEVQSALKCKELQRLNQKAGPHDQQAESLNEKPFKWKKFSKKKVGVQKFQDHHTKAAVDSKEKETRSCHYCKKSGHIKKNCFSWKKKQAEEEKDQHSSDCVEGIEISHIMNIMDTDDRSSWIVDSGCTFHLSPVKEWFEELAEMDGSVLLGNNHTCKIRGMGKIRLRLTDGSVSVLTEGRYIPEIKRNIISLGMLKAFNVKLWWRFREQSSIWASHMYSKYCTSRSPLARTPSGRSSPTWRRLAAAWPIAQPNIRWIIGEGKVLFWDDVWLGEKPIRDLCIDTRGDPAARVADFWSDGQWDRAKVNTIRDQSGMPTPVAEEIMNTPILPDNPDVPRWNLSRCGNFSLASAWDSRRARRPCIPALGDIWHNGFSTTVSVFIWRLISNRIPVDTKLQWRNMALASKCQCCPEQPRIESLQHLFVSGHGATRVWRQFDEWFEGTSHPLLPGDFIPTRTELWAKRINQMAKGHMARTLPCIIFWYLWAERNNCRHNGVRFRPYNVVWQVRLYIQKLVDSGRAQAKHFKGIRFEGLTLPPPRPSAPARRVMVIKWHPPDAPWFKLNIMGRFDGGTGRANGGGIIRDHLGDLVAAFSTPLDACNVLEAELETIYRGMAWAKRRGLRTWIETGSQQAKAAIDSGEWGTAASRHMMVKIGGLAKEGMFRFSYTHQEGNKVAACLAQMGGDSSSFQEMDATSVPRLLAAMVRLERMGLPNIRLEYGDSDTVENLAL